MSDPRVMREIDRLQRDLARLRAQVPVRVAPSASDPVFLTVRIIGGNPLASGVECIQYAASVTPPKVYDPDVDTSYVTGIGNAYLYRNGQPVAGAVLVRHDWVADQMPLRSGRVLRVRGTVTLTYSGTDFTAYTLDWM